MGNVKIPAFAFMFSGIFVIVCCFLPLKTLVVTGGMEETSVLRLMPTLGGFFVLALGIVCVLFPIIGFKSYSALAGTGTALLGGGFLWYYTNNAEVSANQLAQYEEVFDGMFSTLTDEPVVASTITVTTNFGFSLTIIALVLVLITGFWYTFAGEN